jgi:DNA-binding NtrC family response regulator
MVWRTVSDKSQLATDRLSANEPGRMLIAVWTGGSVSRYLPDRGALVIGRGAECDVQIDHLSVSRTHAILRISPGELVTLEDLGSANGTRVRGRTLPARSAEVVSPHDVLEIGEARLLLRLPTVDPGPAPPSSQRGAPRNDPMSELERMLDLVAPSDISVLLTGESGVGKDVTAERIHRLSPRAGRPIVRINCAALPDALLESELFGYERGAFTGAVQSKEGLIESADGGTFFFDEVGEMPLATQAKLLRVIEGREVLRVGGLKPRAIDVRFVSATNKNLRALCDAGAFRHDLYFRLNGITVHVPPLRERLGELRHLVSAFADRHRAKTGKTPPVLTAEAFAHLESHSWPGNIRELRNVIERAFVLSAGGPVLPVHLPFDDEPPPVSAGLPPSGPVSASVFPAAQRPLKEDMVALERQRIIEALNACGGNQTKAARQLGISRRTLLTRLDEWGLPRPRK